MTSAVASLKLAPGFLVEESPQPTDGAADDVHRAGDLICMQDGSNIMHVHENGVRVHAPSIPLDEDKLELLKTLDGISALAVNSRV